MSDDGMRRAFGLATMMMGDGGFPIAPETDFLASRTAAMYSNPSKPLRAISEDYPNGPPIGPDGRITHDIEGRPLTAPYIAGRTSGAGPDQAIAPTQFDALAEGAIGSRPQGVAQSQIPRGWALRKDKFLEAESEHIE